MGNNLKLICLNIQICWKTEISRLFVYMNKKQPDSKRNKERGKGTNTKRRIHWITEFLFIESTIIKKKKNYT